MGAAPACPGHIATRCHVAHGAPQCFREKLPVVFKCGVVCCIMVSISMSMLHIFWLCNYNAVLVGLRIITCCGRVSNNMKSSKSLE